MNEWLPVLVMMNNYFHDVATALLAASAITMIGVDRILATQRIAPDHPAAGMLYRFLTRTALGSLLWIIIGGIPRTIFFARYEWWDAAHKGIVPALVAKHIAMMALVVLGLALWARVRRRRASTPTQQVGTSVRREEPGQR